MNRQQRHDESFARAAVQLQFVTQEQLDSALNGTAAPGQNVAQRLCSQGLLTEADVAAINAVVQRQLDRQVEPHDGDGAPTDRADPAATRADRPMDSATAAPGGTFATQPLAEPPLLEEWRRFAVLRPHAQGGLGRVQIARDQQLSREIALKEILPAHADNPVSRQRFVREAEITGALEHPGVVPVYSLGEYPDGRPFYAMRLIVGQNMRAAIADFHQHGRAAIGTDVRSRQLLGQFIDACHAIHYAHNRGVVHRDLKPENIMLGDYGETLVVDWGLARNYEAPAERDSTLRPVTPSASASSSHTLDGQIVGTPAYMSPEQAAGRLDQLGPSVDVYSLGATLYHLLTGEPPFAGDLHDVLAQVQRGKFPPPRARKQKIPRPLEAICLRAMALRPQDRYPTTLALAQDMERYLADDAVEAYAEPLWARAWRWIRNHRTAVFSLMAAATVALTALSLGVALLGAANQRERRAKEEATANFVEAEKQRRRAEENFQHAQDAVRDYYVTVSEETLLSQPGMQPLRNELLRQALNYYRQFLEQRSDDPALRRQSAQAAFFAGQIAEEIASPEEAIPYYLDAMKHYEQLAGDQPATADVARVANALGGAYQKLNKFELARESYAAARRMREQLSRDNPDDVESARQLSNTLMNLGSLALSENERAEGLKLLQQAQSLRLAHVAGADVPLALERDLAMGYFNLAAAQLGGGEIDGARQHLLDAERAFALLRRREPDEFKHRRRLAITRRLLGDVAAARGEAEAALSYYQQAKETLAELHEENPRVAELTVDLAGVLMNLGSLHAHQANRPLAQNDLAAAAALLEELDAAENSIPRYRRDLAATRRALGQLLLADGSVAEAREALKQSREILQGLVRQFPSNEDYAAQLEATIRSLEELPEEVEEPPPSAD